MLKHLAIGVALFIAVALFSGVAHAKIPEQCVRDFMAAFEAVYQPTMNKTDVEKYLSFMTNDVTDYHASYNVTIKAMTAESAWMNFSEKASTGVEYKIELGEIILGEHMAVVEFREIYKDREGDRIVDGNLRTVLVLEYTKEGLIKHMRRYLDR